MQYYVVEEVKVFNVFVVENKVKFVEVWGDLLSLEYMEKMVSVKCVIIYFDFVVMGG